MTTLTSYKIDSRSKNAITIIGNYKVSFCLRNGHVYDARPNTGFSPAEGCESFEYQFETDQIAIERLEALSSNHLAKVVARKIEDDTRCIAEYNRRKSDVLNLWQWRHGNITAYIVRTYEQCDQYSWNPIDDNGLLFFNENDATTYFESVIHTSPYGANTNAGWSFMTELYEYEGGNDDALQILSTDDLIKKIYEHGNITNYETYADPIPSDHIIINVYNTQPGGSPRYEGCSKPRSSSFWYGDTHYGSQITYADLAAFRDNSPNHWQVTMTISEAVAKFGSRVIEDLHLSREDAIEAGIDEGTVNEYCR